MSTASVNAIRLFSARHRMETTDSEPRAIMCEHMPCRSNVDCECAGWPASPIEHAQLRRRGQGLKRSGGSEH